MAQITRFSLWSLLAWPGCRPRRSPGCGRCSTSRCRRRAGAPVITSQLAGNALAKIAPGGGAMGSALQYKMLVRPGAHPAATVTALTAINVLVFAMVLAMPVLAIPALLRGGVNDTLLDTALVGLGVFASRARPRRRAAHHRPARWRGSGARAARTQPPAPRRRAAARTCRSGCCASATGSLGTLGPRWKRALLATVGRWTFDYLTLLAALAAIGSHPRPGLVLLAFCGAQVLAQIPITPGGLGFVEAGLTAMLALAGGQRRRRGAGDVRLPAVLVLAAAAARAASAMALAPGPAPRGWRGAVGRARARRPRAGGRRRACGRCCAGAS